jgi:hypothetical protein
MHGSNLRGDIVVSAVRGKCGVTFPARLGGRVRDGIRDLRPAHQMRQPVANQDG